MWFSIRQRHITKHSLFGSPFTPKSVYKLVVATWSLIGQSRFSTFCQAKETILIPVCLSVCLSKCMSVLAMKVKKSESTESIKST